MHFDNFFYISPTLHADYCQSNEFQCDNGACIPQTYTCDGYDDCGDYSDEHSSQCGMNTQCLHT